MAKIPQALSKGEETRIIPLTLGQVAVVSSCDYEELSKYQWYAKLFRTGFYAARNYRIFPGKKPGSRGTILMHRQILGISDKTVKGDHVNHDTLDNRRSNLRACSNAENCRNKGAHKNNKLGLKGVIYNYTPNRRKHYGAYIMVDGKRIDLGRFMTAEEGAKAYDEAAIKYHGEYASLNSTAS